VDDDAVGAQVDEPPVAVDQFPEIGLHQMAVADVDDDPGASDDLSVLADLTGPDEEVLDLAGRALEPLLELVVAPRRAGLEGGDDRRHQPVGDVGRGGLPPVAGGDGDRIPGGDGENGADRRVPGQCTTGELEFPSDDPQRLPSELTDLARRRRHVRPRVRFVDDS
jgi:hypothetical protein